MTLIRLGYLSAIAAIGLICAYAPHLFFIGTENFAPMKVFLSLGGFIGMFWLLHEADAKGRRDRKGRQPQ